MNTSNNSASSTPNNPSPIKISFNIFFLKIYHSIRWLLKRILDLINLLILSLSYFRSAKRFEKDKIKKVLIINLQGIGDQVMMTPFVESLEKEFGKIDILCKDGRIFKNDLNVKTIGYKGIISSLRIISKTGYDLIICPYRAEHAAFLTVASSAKYKIGYLYSLKLSSNNMLLNHMVPEGFLEYKSITRDPKIKCEKIRLALNLAKVRDYEDLDVKTTSDEKKKIEKMLNNLKNNKSSQVNTDEKIIVLCCQNKWISRSWPENNWIQLIRLLLKDSNVLILLIGSIDDKEKNIQIIKTALENSDNDTKRVIDLSADISLSETVELLKKTDTFITTDCGPMHLGVAAKVKNMITLWGSTDPEELLAKKYLKTAIWKNKNGKYSAMYNHNNEPIVDKAVCMDKIQVHDVAKYIGK